VKILVVEDEPEMRQILKSSLEKEQFLVECASDLQSAIDKVVGYDYDCILLDVMLPDGSGLKLLEQLKAMKKADRVIILSAKDSLEDKLAGLESGADDYLPKPFHLAELNARVKSVLRRKLAEGQHALEAGNLTLNLADRAAQVNGQPLALNRKEFDILAYLTVNRDRLVRKTALAEHVWGDHADEMDSYEFIYAQIKNVRRKLTAAGANAEIQAVYGMGYKLTVA